MRERENVGVVIWNVMAIYTNVFIFYTVMINGVLKLTLYTKTNSNANLIKLNFRSTTRLIIVDCCIKIKTIERKFFLNYTFISHHHFFVCEYNQFNLQIFLSIYPQLNVLWEFLLSFTHDFNFAVAWLM
jgi:hypothetical protein